MDWQAVLSILLRLLAVVALVLLNGFFVAAEFALVKVRDTQLRPLINRGDRSEEHTSELQSQSNLVCRLLLEKKKHRWSLACALPAFPCSTSSTDWPGRGSSTAARRPLRCLLPPTLQRQPPRGATGRAATRPW